MSSLVTKVDTRQWSDEGSTENITIDSKPNPSSFPNGEGDGDHGGDGDDDGELPIELQGPQDYGVGCLGLREYHKY